MKKILFCIIICFVFANCSKTTTPKIKECSKPTEPEALNIVNMATDNTLSYPPDFYIDVSPAAMDYYIILTPSAGSLAEADAIFEYANTVTARNYTLLSSSETDKYYKRVWVTGLPDGAYKEMVFKNAYISTKEHYYRSFFLQTVDAAHIKEFFEFYFLNLAPTFTTSDILSSSVSEYPDYFAATIVFSSLNHYDTTLYVRPICELISVRSITINIYKLNGYIDIDTPPRSAHINSYITGKLIE